MSTFSHAPVKERLPRVRPWGVLVQLLLFANIVIGVVLGWSIQQRVSALDHYRAGTGSLASVATLDGRVHDWAIAEVVGFVGTGIVFVTWFALTYRAAERTNPHLLRHGRGWAIGSWVTPILGLWRPPHMVNDALTALERPSDEAGWSPPGHPLVSVWWATVLASSLIDRFNPSWTTVDDLRRWSRIESSARCCRSSRRCSPSSSSGG